MRVLNISLDEALLNGTGEGDSIERFKYYRQHCESFSVLVPTLKPFSKRTQENIEIFPAYGVNKLLAYWKVYTEGKRICKEKQTDLIVTNDAVLGWIALQIKRTIPIKIQINVFGMGFLNREWRQQNPLRRLLTHLQKQALQHADSIRTDNTKEKEILEKQLHIKTGKMIVIPVAPSQKTQDAFKQAKRDQNLRNKLLKNKKYLILSVGRLVKEKDFLNLLTAGLILKNKGLSIQIVIAGDGPEKDTLLSYIKENDLDQNVTLLGSVPHEQLPALYVASDLYVLSSYVEGLPRVLMYAALARVPIITTDIDGAFDIVKDKQSGIIVKRINSKQLAEAIEWLFEYPERAYSWADKARSEAIIKLELETNVNKLIESWRLLVSH